MCGIAGFLGFCDNHIEVLKSMVFSIRHRGPDAQNQWFDTSSQIALGHSRLAVVDLSEAGSQPMTSPSNRYVVTYNGEIYNHQLIRKSLNQIGGSPSWIGGSDTETLLAAFDCWGIEKTLQMCIGMFAFAVWDNTLQSLTLVRDRFGEKPLYYQPTSDGVIFASELTSIAQHPSCAEKISVTALKHLAEESCIPSPLSVYENVFKLLPGTFITFKRGGDFRTEQWWSATDSATKNYETWKGTEADALVELESRLVDSVELQMIADVPLGSFLSGGIDSSLITAIMQHSSANAIKTFTIGFEQNRFNEAPFAKRVAEHLGTIHTEHYVTDSEVIDLIPQIPCIYSEPFADSSQLPTFLVSKLAREEVTVALSGDAGDEIFAGYNRHLFTRNYWKKVQKIPRPIRQSITSLMRLTTEKQLDRIVGSLPFASDWTRVGEKIKRSGYALSANSLGDLYRDLTRLESSAYVLGVHDRRADLSTKEFGPQIGILESSAETNIMCDSMLDPMRWMMLKDQCGYLHNDVLTKVDRAAMACSLETRTPFLDHTLVEFVQKLPSSWLVEGEKGKKPLRKILEKHIPKDIFERPKMGFAIPVNEMIRSPLRDWAENLLSKTSIEKGGAFNAQQISKMWTEHLSGNSDNISKLWPVLMYQAWQEK